MHAFHYVRLSLVLGILGLPVTARAKDHVDHHGNIDSRVNPQEQARPLTTARAAKKVKGRERIARDLERGKARLKAAKPKAEISLSQVTESVEVVSSTDRLTEAAPGRSGFEIVRDFLTENTALYGLMPDDIANLRFIGESVSEASDLRMVRVEQMVNGHAVFQSETRFTMDRDGRLIRSVGLIVPNASATAEAATATVSAPDALVAALASVDILLKPELVKAVNTSPNGHKTEVAANDSRVAGNVASELVYFPVAPGVLIPAWSQVSFTNADGDWMTLVDSNTGDLLWRKNIRSHISSQDARFSVYVQADGTTPADNPAPMSPTTTITGSGTQAPEISRTTVNMFTAQNTTASRNGWISDGGTTTTGNNTDTYLDRDSNNSADRRTLDSNGRPRGNSDVNGRNRDFLGTNYSYSPPPVTGNPESGTVLTDSQYQRGVVTQLFYLVNWYHDRLYALGFDTAAGNFQTNNFGGGGSGNDPVLAEAQDGAGNTATSSNRNNANFSTPPDGSSGRMQMYIFDGPTVDRDGSLDSEIVIHELTHGLSNRLIGNGAGLSWDVGGGMGEGWSDFYALSLLNHTNADNPNGKYAAGAYATYKLASASVTDNYLYGIRRFPYSTDNAVNPLTWADVDDVTNNLSGGIAASPLNFNGNGGCEVHNIGEIWCNSLWEVRSRVIADPAGANGDVPTGNNRMLQIVTDAMKMTPINPSFIDARDALIAADAATNASANEKSIWEGFADRGLGYKAVAPFSRMAGWVAGHMGIGESFEIPYLDVENVTIDDSIGNNNGAVDPNEPVEITVRLKNPWLKASCGVASATATLATSTAGVSVITNSSTYPAIPASGSADGSKFQFVAPAGATAGQLLKFTINVTSSLGTKAVDFSLRVGTPAGNGAPITYTSTIAGGLSIPDNSPRGVVNNLTITDDYEIADLNFRLDSLTHTYTGEVSVMLRAPNGLGSDLISLVGYGVNSSGGSTGDNFTNTVIDDQASGSLLNAASTAAPYTGTWKAVFNDNWTDKDPVGQLGRYAGLSTKGDWKVLVADESATDTGKLNAWSLIITPKAYTVTPYVGNTPITVAVSPDGTTSNLATVNFTLTFSEPVTGLTAAGIAVTNGIKGALAGIGAVYTMPVTPSGQGIVTCMVNAGAAQGALLIGNDASNTAAVSYDSVTQPPVLTVPVNNSITGSPVGVAFSLPETAFAGTVKLTFVGGVTRTLTLASSQQTIGTYDFDFDPASPASVPEIASIAGGSSIPDGSYTVSVAYQDQFSNPASSSTITHVTIDTLAPVVTPPADVVAEASGTSGAIVTYPVATASDAVGVVSLTYSQDSGAVFPIGMTTVTVTATDAANNVGTVTFTVLVADTLAPVVMPPSDVVAEASGTSGAIVTYPVATASDAVGVVSLTYSQDSGMVFPIGMTTVTVTATDAANNISTATFTVSVADTLAPVVTPPSDVVAEASGSEGAIVTYPVATASDAVGVVSLTYSQDSDTIFPIGMTTVTVTATDAANNVGTVTFTVSVADTLAPLVTPPSDVVAEASGFDGAIVTYPDATASDAVGVVSLTYSQDSGTTFPIGMTTVTVSATDAANNVGTATFTISVADTLAPVVTPPSDVVAEASSSDGAIVTYPIATANDAVGVASLTYSQDSGAVFPIGMTTVIVTATDAANNIGTATFTVSVADTFDPVVTPPADVVVESTGSDGAIVTYPAAAASDAVGVVSLTYSKDSGTTFPIGMTTVTVTAMDAANNVGTATFTVSVSPLTPIQAWREIYFASIEDAGDAADMADPNHNGIVNLLEYALGGDPLGDTTGQTILPTQQLEGHSSLVLSLTRIPTRNDITLTVQAADSPDGPWTDLARCRDGAAFAVIEPGAVIVETAADSTISADVADVVPFSDSGHPRRFMRLQVARE